jgi:hypothetical protein
LAIASPILPLAKTLVPLLGLACFGLANAAVAQPIANPVATFAGLDKITGRITRFDVYIDETVLFRSRSPRAPATTARPPRRSVCRRFSKSTSAA